MKNNTPAAKANPTKKASAKKFAPIIIDATPGCGLLYFLPQRRLGELLRERGIGIPKTKAEMVERLDDWFAEREQPTRITIQ